MIHVPTNPDEFASLPTFDKIFYRIVVTCLVVIALLLLGTFYSCATRRKTPPPPVRRIVHVAGGVVDINCGDQP